MQICKKESAYLHNGPFGSHRWITIGTVWEHGVSFHNWGVPNAIELNCKGARHTFMKWDHVFWALRNRLSHGRLQLVAVASTVQKNIYGQPSLIALVARETTPRPRQQEQLAEFG